MIKDDRKYSEIQFQPVLSGGIACLHRPSKGGIQLLPQSHCTAVITLLSQSENPHEIGNACKTCNLLWTWVPLQGANKRLLESNNTGWLIRKALLKSKALLEQGHFILIHCAAGIHRTGLFTFALLRISGLEKPDALETLRRIRTVTYEKCGTTRLDLAEALAEQIIIEKLSRNIEELKELELVQRVNEAYLWIKITPSHNGMLRVECIVTDREINKYVLGPNMNVIIDYGYLGNMCGKQWIGTREVEYLPGGVSKGFVKAEEDILRFCTDSFPEKSGVVIGRDIWWEWRFIQSVWGKLSEYLSNHIMTLNEPPADSIYQELIRYKLYLNKNVGF